MQPAPNNAEELKRCVEEAFADTVYPVDGNITISECPCAECCDAREFFQGKHWRDLVEGSQELPGLWAGLAILSPEAWRFYLPAYLIVGLGKGAEDYSSVNPAECARESALCQLSPRPPEHEWFNERAFGFSVAQQKCLADYACAISEAEPEEEDYAVTAAYWKARAVEASDAPKAV